MDFSSGCQRAVSARTTASTPQRIQQHPSRDQIDHHWPKYKQGHTSCFVHPLQRQSNSKFMLLKKAWIHSGIIKWALVSYILLLKQYLLNWIWWIAVEVRESWHMVCNMKEKRRLWEFLERSILSFVSTMSLLIFVFFLYFLLLLRIFCQNYDFYRSRGFFLTWRYYFAKYLIQHPCFTDKKMTSFRS